MSKTGLPHQTHHTQHPTHHWRQCHQRTLPQKYGPTLIHHWPMGTIWTNATVLSLNITPPTTERLVPWPPLWASTPPCLLGILTYADIQWSNSKSTSCRTFFGNSYTAQTPSLHTIQLMGLGITKAFSSLLCSATSKFSLPVHTTFHLYIFLTSEDTYDICRYLPKLNIYISIIYISFSSKAFTPTSKMRHIKLRVWLECGGYYANA